jgi:putative DNA primase/helicase
LDKLVQAERPDDDSKQGRAVSFPEPELWPEPVNGAALLDSIAEAIRRYIILSDHSRDATALWAIHTYLIDCFLVSPRLAGWAMTCPSPISCGACREPVRADYKRIWPAVSNIAAVAPALLVAMQRQASGVGLPMWMIESIDPEAAEYLALRDVARRATLHG